MGHGGGGHEGDTGTTPPGAGHARGAPPLGWVKDTAVHKLKFSKDLMKRNVFELFENFKKINEDMT